MVGDFGILQDVYMRLLYAEEALIPRRNVEFRLRRRPSMAGGYRYTAENGGVPGSGDNAIPFLRGSTIAMRVSLRDGEIPHRFCRSSITMH